mmetsp:Transcript_5170/g.14854  ORF Transcript_5170/g.14854 Transcript_5170/m.14854 type:complete len:270 (-) Transcript_5170:183-992(-)
MTSSYEDSLVRETNDDAQLSKLSCVNQGYFEDDFVRYFVRRPKRRPPIINRGYYSRSAALRGLLAQFLRVTAAATVAAEAQQALSGDAVKVSNICSSLSTSNAEAVPPPQYSAAEPAATAAATPQCRRDGDERPQPQPSPEVSAPTDRFATGGTSSAASPTLADEPPHQAPGSSAVRRPDGEQAPPAQHGHRSTLYPEHPLQQSPGSPAAGGATGSAGGGTDSGRAMGRQVLSLGAGFDTTWFHYKVFTAHPRSSLVPGNTEPSPYASQ